MAVYKLSSELRNRGKKSEINNLRNEGKVPAIYYYHREEPVPITVDSHDLKMALHSGAHIIELQMGTKMHKCILRELQHDPISEEIIHADFMGISLKEDITVEIPIHLEGTAVGVKESGGVLAQHLWELHIKCKPGDIPDSITVDVTELDIGDSIAVDDIKVENVEVLNSPTTSIVSVVQPTRVKLEAEEVAEELEEELEEGEEGAAEEGEGEGPTEEESPE